MQIYRKKINIFYEQAFDTLFARHDATKEAFKRKMYSGISIDVFKRALSLFCFITYYEGKNSFSDKEIIEIIEKSMKIEKYKIQADSFLKDMMESVCLLQKDGIQIMFTHRSFQEFFAAYCLAHVQINNFRYIVSQFSMRRSDSVIRMLYEMNRDLLENSYIIPMLRELVKAMEEEKELDVITLNKKIYGESMQVHVSQKKFYASRSHGNDYHTLRYVLRDLYTDFYKDIVKKYPHYEKLDSECSVEFINELKSKNKKKRVQQMVLIESGIVDGKIYGRTVGEKMSKTIDMSWIVNSGFYQFCIDENNKFREILISVEESQNHKNKTIEEIIGINERN